MCFYQSSMRIQEEKIELQKNVHRKICVREIIFWLHVLQKMVRDRGEEGGGEGLVPPTLQCLLSSVHMRL